jgi:hypothetical protein
VLSATTAKVTNKKSKHVTVEVESIRREVAGVGASSEWVLGVHVTATSESQLPRKYIRNLEGRGWCDDVAGPKVEKDAHRQCADVSETVRDLHHVRCAGD